MLAVLTPAAFVAGGTPASLPVDVTLGVLYPLHAHIGMNYVISDYIPKATRGIARGGMLGFTIMTCAGLLKLNMEGPGLTETVKSFWRKPK
jgi:succinate dehydrogenase (ubiquinone) membrane anchor subunit